MNRVSVLEKEEDGDFNLNPRLCVVSSLGKNPSRFHYLCIFHACFFLYFVFDGSGWDFEFRWPIGSIKDWKSDAAAERIPQVVKLIFYGFIIKILRNAASLGNLDRVFDSCD